MIEGQTSDGHWTISSRAILVACLLTEEDFDSNNVRQEISTLALPSETNEKIFVTLLACYLLQEAFADHEDEWQLIVDKAKTWLIA